MAASSRAYKGQDVLEALGVQDAVEAVTPGLRVCDVGPDQIRCVACARVNMRGIVMVIYLVKGGGSPATCIFACCV